VVVDSTEFGTVYNIGDLVSCVSKRFGVKFNARISGMKYTKDASGEKTEIILGEPKLTAIGEVKLSG
jgi:prophage tail gpP-like protein